MMSLMDGELNMHRKKKSGISMKENFKMELEKDEERWLSRMEPFMKESLEVGRFQEEEGRSVQEVRSPKSIGRQLVQPSSWQNSAVDRTLLDTFMKYFNNLIKFSFIFDEHFLSHSRHTQISFLNRFLESFFLTILAQFLNSTFSSKFLSFSVCSHFQEQFLLFWIDSLRIHPNLPFFLLLSTHL